jgi:hypothetical protein
MTVKVEEFINPKSMLTPGGVAAVVATASGATFTNFGLSLPFALTIFSFFFAGVVFHSKEFNDGSIGFFGRGFYYLLNVIIIFAMATGTHAILDKKKGGLVLEFNLINSAYAQSGGDSLPTLKQRKPLFYDWTQSKDSIALQVPKNDALTYQVTQEQSGLKAWFVDKGVLQADYKVKLKIDKSKLPEIPKSVKWMLPQDQFGTGSFITTNKDENFQIEMDVWKSFILEAEVELESGNKIKIYNNINPGMAIAQ